MNTPLLPKCPICRKGPLLPATTVRRFKPRGKTVSVELLASKCEHCGKKSVRAADHAENLKRLADRKNRPEYEGLLLGEQILALRHRYGLKQQDASKVFGKGKIAFSRYENEVTYPDDSTTLLLRMAMDKPDCMKWLADRAGVELPLWEVRCEESKLSVRKVPSAPVIRLVAGRADVMEQQHSIDRSGDIPLPYAA
jgi:HTH-type transcriptional regulator/antitoxin MqsA